MQLNPPGWAVNLGQWSTQHSSKFFAIKSRATYITDGWGTRTGTVLGSRSTGFGDGREFNEIRDGSHELFSPAKIKMEGDGVSVFGSELGWNVVGNM